MNETNTKLVFNPSKLSANILKRYATVLLEDVEIDTDYKIPEKYKDNNLDYVTYKAILDMAILTIKEWKKNLILEKNIENLYSKDYGDIEQDSKFYYESFKIIQHEVKNNQTTLFEFFKLFHEIISELVSRNFIDVDVKFINSYTLEISSAPIPSPIPSPLVDLVDLDDSEPWT